jgi:aryl-alcohol dehydrogenase-like predicted oxidoreductase
MDRTEAFSAEAARAQLKASLEALGVEAIDVYQFHSGADVACLDPSLWEILTKEQQGGRIRHLGISILGKGSEVQAQESRRLGAAVLQVFYNRLDRRPETMYFPYAQRDHLGVLARVPLASGLLTGKYREDPGFSASDWRSTLDPVKLRADLAEIQRLQEHEVPAGVPIAQWALAWCLRNPLVSAVIPGCKDAAQVRANAASAALVAEQ